MIVIVSLDKSGGMAFNQRRLSKDSAVRERIVRLSGGRRIRMNRYSAGQFCESEIPSLAVSEDFMEMAQDGEICFIENIPIREYEEKIEKIVVYRWNRDYPADVFFDIPLEKWKKVSESDFEGTSHEKITEEEYVK